LALRTELAAVFGAGETTGFVAIFGALRRVELVDFCFTAALGTAFFIAGVGAALREDLTGNFFAGALAMVFIAFFGAVVRAVLAGFFLAGDLAAVFTAFFGTALRVEATLAFFTALAGSLRAVLEADEALPSRSVFFAPPLRVGFAATIVLLLRGAAVFLLAMICSSGCVRPGRPRREATPRRVGRGASIARD